MPIPSALLFILISFCSIAQEWNSITPIPSIGRDDAVAFSLNNLGFVVTGAGDGSDYSESNRLFCYNPINNSWIEKTAFPGVKRQYSSVFTIEGKAYLIGGYSESGAPLNDVWSYNENQDLWTQLNNFPGLARWDASSTSLSGFGYFGLGTNLDSTLSDLWRYNPKKDEWTLVSHYPSGGNRSVLAFPLLDEIIFGEGFSVNPITYANNWFSYNPSSETWAQINSTIAFRSYGTVVSNGVSAIICGGMNENGVFQNDCYQLDFSRKWTELNTIGTEGLRGSSGFVIGNDFYIGTGLKANGSKTSEFYVYSQIPIILQETKVFPNPSNSGFNIVSQPEIQVKIYSVDGKLLVQTITDVSGYLFINQLTSGLYIVKVLNNDKEVKFTIEKI